MGRASHSDPALAMVLARSIDIDRIGPPQCVSECCADEIGGRDAEGLSTLEERGLQAVQIDAESNT